MTASGGLPDRCDMIYPAPPPGRGTIPALSGPNCNDPSIERMMPGLGASGRFKDGGMLRHASATHVLRPPFRRLSTRQSVHGAKDDERPCGCRSVRMHPLLID